MSPSRLPPLRPPGRKRRSRGVVEADLRACWSNLESGCRRTPGAVALLRARPGGASPAQVEQFLEQCRRESEADRLAFATVAAELLVKVLPAGTLQLDVRAALGLRDA